MTPAVVPISTRVRVEKGRYFQRYMGALIHLLHVVDVYPDTSLLTVTVTRPGPAARWSGFLPIGAVLETDKKPSLEYIFGRTGVEATAPEFGVRRNNTNPACTGGVAR